MSMMTREDLKRMRNLHRERPSAISWCVVCKQSWPCEVVQLLRHSEAQDKLLEQVKEAAEAAVDYVEELEVIVFADKEPNEHDAITLLKASIQAVRKWRAESVHPS